MKIVVIGGTGLIGSKLVSTLSKQGHEVIAASPSTGVDTITGEGLEDVLKGTEVVVDVANSPSFEDEAVMRFFQTSGSNLLRAEQKAGVGHHVALSIVGTDRVPGSGYLRAKLAQENLIRESKVAYTILRSTQFFEFAKGIAYAATVDDEVHVSTGPIQPIFSDEVVEALAEIVNKAPLNDITEIGGPVPMTMAEFIGQYLQATNDSRKLVVDENALYFGATLNDDSILPGSNARLGTLRFEDWLSGQLVKA